MIDLLDTGGDLTLTIEGIKKLIDVTEVRNETFNVVTSAGMGVQQRDKIGYGVHCSNGDTNGITAHLTDTLGTVNGYNAKSTKCIIKAFRMNTKLSDYCLSKLKYDSQAISGVMGLKNATIYLQTVQLHQR